MSQARPELFCPHFDQAAEGDLRRLFSKVAAVRAEDSELFDYTHRPMTVFPSDEASRHTEHEITEDQILEDFSTERVGNHAVVIEGEVGTGKSELCAYLVHRLREEGRPILRVDKDDDLMSILTKRLPEFYETHFDEELPGAADFQQLEQDIKQTPKTIASFATTSALLNFKKQDFDVAYTDDDEAEMTALIKDQLQQLVTKGEYAKRSEVISKQAYDRKPFLQVFTGDVTPEEAVEKWNDELWSGIRDRYDTPPLSEMLKKVGAKFEDTRPVAVFEDFSIASIEAKKLRNYIERDVSEDNWDFIIAGTRDVTDVLHTRTGEDRFEFYQTNVPDSNSVLFLDEDTAVDFIRPYLAYVKHEDGSVPFANGPIGNGDVELLAPEDDSKCYDCPIVDRCPRDLFPFNEVFLRRIYMGFDESQQSPREYVMKVFDVLKEYYLGGVDVPSSSSHLGADVTNSETPADAVYEDAEVFADLAKWYGVEQDGAYVVDRALALAFGLVGPDTETNDIGAGVEVTESEIRIPAAGTDGAIGRGSDDDDDEDDDDIQTDPRSKVERLFDEHTSDVDDWINDPTNDRFTETNDYIATAAEDLINHLTDDYTIWTDGDLRYNLSSSKRPFVWTAGNESAGSDQIRIDTTDLRRSEARDLLEHGIRRKESSGSADRDEVLETFGTQFTEYATWWRQTIRHEYLNTHRVLFKKSKQRSYDFDDFVLAAYAWVVMLDDPWQDLSAEGLNNRFTADDDLEIDEHLDDKLEGVLPLDEYQLVTDLFEYADDLEDLMATRFGLTSNALDVRAIRKRFTHDTPFDVLDALAKKYIDRIESRVRFAPSKTLPDLATTLYQLTSVLEDLERENGEALLELPSHVESQLKGIDMDRICDIEAGMDAYAAVDSQFKEALNQFSAHDQDTIDDIITACQQVDDLISNAYPETQDRIHAALVSIKIYGSPPVTNLDQLETNWPDVSSELGGTRFTEVSNYYVE